MGSQSLPRSIFVEPVPQRYRERVREACLQVLNRCDDLLAIVLIGSVAEGDFVPESDVDLLCVKEEKLPWEEQREIKEQLDEQVQLIFFDRKTLAFHFQHRTTMAHAVLRGKILYEVENYIGERRSDTLGLPDRGWMKNWFLHWLKLYGFAIGGVDRSEGWHRKYCDRTRHDHTDDTLARVAVNFCILFLEIQGLVPTTKSQILRHFRDTVDDQALIEGLELALVVSRQERWMTYEEGKTVAQVAAWLRGQLIGHLKPTAEDLKEMEQIEAVLHRREAMNEGAVEKR